MAVCFELDEPAVFTAGAVGEPGSRVFYLQAQQSGRVVTLRLEKEQVAALGEYLGGLLENLAPVTDPLPVDLELVQPAVEEWIVGTLAVEYRESEDRVIVVAEELVRDQGGDETDPSQAESDPFEPSVPESLPESFPESFPESLLEGAPATARFSLTREQVAAFVPHAASLIAAGRPPCPVCGRPVDADGHVCSRSNGHGR